MKSQLWIGNIQNYIRQVAVRILIVLPAILRLFLEFSLVSPGKTRSISLITTLWVHSNNSQSLIYALSCHSTAVFVTDSVFTRTTRKKTRKDDRLFRHCFHMGHKGPVKSRPRCIGAERLRTQMQINQFRHCKLSDSRDWDHKEWCTIRRDAVRFDRINIKKTATLFLLFFPAGRSKKFIWNAGTYVPTYTPVIYLKTIIVIVW